jgi:hypothetical protein
MNKKNNCIFPGYNWCGPCCSGPDDPINDVDACCKKHDECLNNGINRCECDIEMLRCLKSKIDFNTEKGRVAAIMYLYFKFKVVFTC